MIFKKRVAVLVTAYMLSLNLAHASTPPSVFTPEQQAEVGKIAGDYLVAHPEILLQVSQKLQQQQRARQQVSMSVAVMGSQAQLLNDKNTPAIGPVNAKVAVIEFFDYQCIYCSKLAPELKNVMMANPGVKFMFKEWPIFGSRWKTSQDAAERGLAIWLHFGAKPYMAYHDALYQTGHAEGALTPEDIDKATHITAPAQLKLLSTPLADVGSEIEANNELAQKLGLTGTPGLIIMPVTGATPDKITVLPGVAPQAVIEEAIAHAAK